MLERANELNELLVGLRRSVHRHPELGFQERRTAALIAERLTGLGVSAQTGVGLTGVVGDLGKQGPRVALRADIDALPIQEENDTEYA